MPIARTTPKPITDEEWNIHESDIRQLLLEDRRPLLADNGIIQHLECTKGFKATKSQYETRIRKWGLSKNATKEDWKIVDQHVDSREVVGKRSEVFLHGRQVEPMKLQRQRRRYRKDSPVVVEELAQLPSCFRILTPPSSRDEDRNPTEDATSDHQRSQASGAKSSDYATEDLLTQPSQRKDGLCLVQPSAPISNAASADDFPSLPWNDTFEPRINIVPENNGATDDYLWEFHSMFPEAEPTLSTKYLSTTHAQNEALSMPGAAQNAQSPATRRWLDERIHDGPWNSENPRDKGSVYGPPETSTAASSRKPHAVSLPIRIRSSR